MRFTYLQIGVMYIDDDEGVGWAKLSRWRNNLFSRGLRNDGHNDRDRKEGRF